MHFFCRFSINTVILHTSELFRINIITYFTKSEKFNCIFNYLFICVADKMNAKTLMVFLALVILVEGKQREKRQIPFSRLRCILLQVCSPQMQPPHCIPGAPGCNLPIIPRCIGGIGTTGCQPAVIPEPSPVIIPPKYCPIYNPRCIISQRDNPQLIVQPSQVHTRVIPYSVNVQVPKINYIKQLVAQTYPVQQIVHIPVEKQVVVEKPVVRYITQRINVVRDRHVPYPVYENYPVFVTEKVPVFVPVYPDIDNSTSNTNITNTNTTTSTTSDMKNYANVKDAVNITISINNININNVTGSTTLKNERNETTSNERCCAVVGPTECEKNSCLRTRYQRCGTFCKSFRIIIIQPRIYVPQPYPVPVLRPDSRCYPINDYPYMDCTGCKFLINID